MEFDLEYKIQLFREAQSGYYDEDGKRYSATPISSDNAELMLQIINELESALVKAETSEKQALNIPDVSISLPDYEYEMFIDDEGTPFEINSWIPIATDRIKDINRIDEYIQKGLIRKRQ